MPPTLNCEGPILVTGGCGFIGAHLTSQLIRDGHEVIVLDWKVRNVMQGVALYAPVDIRDRDGVMAVLSRRRPGVIFHLAAQSAPQLSIRYPQETLDINVNGTTCLFETILEVAKSGGAYAPVVIVAGSSAAYGDSCNASNEPVAETARFLPLTPYGVSKAGQDLLTYQYWRQHGLHAVCARIFNTSGPGKSGDVSSDLVQRVADILQRGGALKAGNLSSRRAYLDVRDTVDALIGLAVSGRPGEAYNISAEIVRSVSDLIAILEQQAGRAIEVMTDPALARSVDEPLIAGDTAKLRQATGWRPRADFADTLGEMLRIKLETA